MPKVLYLLFAMLLITSCGSDDDTDVFVPLEIQTQEDFVQVYQGLIFCGAQRISVGQT